MVSIVLAVCVCACESMNEEKNNISGEKERKRSSRSSRTATLIRVDRTARIVYWRRQIWQGLRWDQAAFDALAWILNVGID